MMVVMAIIVDNNDMCVSFKKETPRIVKES